MSTTTTLSRRHFIQTSGLLGAGLVLGVSLPGCHKNPSDSLSNSDSDNNPVSLNAYLKIAPDNRITIIVTKLEMGQGTYTGLATLVAEELDADWSQVSVEAAPVNPDLYGYQGTGGSYAIAGSFQPLREAGATARQMLLAAAAQRWQVTPDSLDIEAGVIYHRPSQRQTTFGAVAELAAGQPVPTEVTLKDSKDFRLMGHNIARKDTGKTDGTAIYTQDIQLPDMLTAVVAHAPRFGARVAAVDSSLALAVPGVVAVLPFEHSVAVLAPTFWQARQGREQLKIDWDESEAMQQSSDQLFAHYHQLADTPGLVAEAQGDIESAFQDADQVIEASYTCPYLAHAPMEPSCCVVQLHGDRAEYWYGCQLPTGDRRALADLLGMAPEQIEIHTQLAGGSFGRRLAHDCVQEATRIAQAYRANVPIKLVWTREQDTRAGYYRPMTVQRLKAALNKEGQIIGWQHRVVGQSINESMGYDAALPDGSMMEGAVELPYAIANTRIEQQKVEMPVSVLWWRSVSHTHTAFAKEAFLDQLAAATGQDPLQLRINLLHQHPHQQKVLQLAADKAGWQSPLPEGHFRGLALHHCFGTTVAQVAEIALSSDGSYRVTRVICAVDCGLAVNPDVVAAQMEGGIGFGLSAALLSEISFRDGQVQQSSFHDYQVLRMPQMPRVEVHIMPSDKAPTGVGEPAVPVIAPAVANALRAARGKPVLKLPII